ncbi:zinc-binding alcohol dehydrogenase family protein [Frigoribacterium sp. CFBP 13729]|jgi:NADPH:quinone reductase-like Zn-dependent oxidoreductase|uniref:zinc-binding alcohol dehydrogenase family protein n=1 Tax=unclassified Frigoribacterium TaxID=2627005 RepID=UPI00177E8249|nr:MULTISPECIES: zinc-binding alcohol dehydrogenase family protein [unclassified Frigoribacterium]MBD8585397.1 zinc-binding alcohol dehydrogenase family protein [Frigoribacterium sp. CFBP 8766]MBD8611963.1 zinc-binding alcohol dehydrogenase family protein [Frigoribacterium sp. CFBP 13729]
MTTNAAARLPAPGADLVVGPAPVPEPGPGELLVRNRAVAVNPLDDVKQWTGNLMYRWLPWPVVLGEDVSGEVVAVGAGADRFRVGDRVVAYAVGMERGRRHEAEGGFQHFTVVREDLAAPLPDGLAHEEAVVLPLGISTAATALFQQDHLALPLPSSAPTPTGRTVVVWGGATSVGSNAIQLAVAAGHRVATTASPRNHDAMRRLGAEVVVDYRSPGAVAELVAGIGGADVAGVLAVGTGSAEPSVEVAIATGATRVALASPSVSFGSLPRGARFGAAFVRTMTRLAAGNVALQVRARRHGIRARYVWGSTLMTNEVGPALWRDHLPSALAEGRHVCAPAPEVVGEGLESVQVALDRLRAGVSARKLVVRL